MSGCDLGLDVRHFGVFFGKRKGLTTNPATRPFWVVVGSGIDIKVVDLTIADEMTYKALNDGLETYGQERVKKGIKNLKY